MKTIDDKQIMDWILERAEAKNLSGILLESYIEGFIEGIIIGTVKAMRIYGVTESDILEQIKEEFGLNDTEAIGIISKVPKV